MVALTDLVCALDPVRLAERTGIVCDPWQAEMLRSSARQLLLNCSRQSGKSLTVALLALHQTLYTPGSLVLVVSATQRQSGELFKKVVEGYRALGRPVPSESETALTLTLENGSRVVALPGKDGTIRGFSGVDLLLVDEAAWVADQTYHAVRPMLAVSGGRLCALSTPWGRRGWFWEAWERGDAWERYRVRASECPRISPAFLLEERRALPALVYASEYEAEFTETVDRLFAEGDLQDALVAGAGRPPLWPDGLPFAGAAGAPLPEARPWS